VRGACGSFFATEVKEVFTEARKENSISGAIGFG